MPGTGWRTGNSGSQATRVPTGGMQQLLSRRQVDDENVVADYGLNFRYTPDDTWQFNSTPNTSAPSTTQLDMSVFGSNFADQELDITGNLPVVVSHKPLTLSATWAGSEPGHGGRRPTSNISATARRRSGARRWTISSTATARKSPSSVDVAYNFQDDGFLRRIKFGARYADRDQTIRYTTYNWGAISEVWSGTRGAFMRTAGQAAPTAPNSTISTISSAATTPGPVGGYLLQSAT